MDIEEIINLIKVMTDDKALNKIEVAARKRRKELGEADYRRRCEEAWAAVKFMKPGDTLYVAMTGTMIGGPGLQRGDKVKVYTVQPRKKRLWLTLPGGKVMGFNPAGVNRYSFSQFPPEKPLSQYERKLAKGMGKLFSL